ncbi:hypothetical protein L208DRAFT_1375273 [Tricholoma matsutake]|nr:hypothetical protein L208DRAFT_1375273 [Tricholoma matsutake 945]
MLDWMELTEEEAAHRKDIYDRTCTHIGNWYQHHYKKVASTSGNKVQEILQSMHEMAAAKHPKKHAAINLYSDCYYKTCMKEKFDKLWATVSQTLPRSACIRMCKTFINKCWKKEQVEFREELEKETEETYKAEMKAFQNGMMWAPQTAEEYHQVMEDSASTLIPFVDAISQHLGVYVAVMMVGLLNDGKVVVQRKCGQSMTARGFWLLKVCLQALQIIFFVRKISMTGGENQSGGGVMVPNEVIDPVLLAALHTIQTEGQGAALKTPDTLIDPALLVLSDEVWAGGRNLLPGTTTNLTLFNSMAASNAHGHTTSGISSSTTAPLVSPIANANTPPPDPLVSIALESNAVFPEGLENVIPAGSSLRDSLKKHVGFLMLAHGLIKKSVWILSHTGGSSGAICIQMKARENGSRTSVGHHLARLGQTAMGEGRHALDGQESWKKAVKQVMRALQNVKVFILQSREDGGTMEDESMPKAAHALGSKS